MLEIYNNPLVLGEYGVVYCLISPSGKRYIGQTWNITKRLYYYQSISSNSQQKIYNAIKKYGFENFEVEILDFCFNQEEMDDSEIYWIKFYNSIISGYNIRGGGSRGRWSDDMKKLISEKTKLGMKNNPRTEESYKLSTQKLVGRKRSNETKCLMSKNRKGKNVGVDHHLYGKHLPEETRNKIGIKNRGKKRSDDTKKAIGKKSKEISYWTHHEMPLEMLKNKSKSAEIYEYTLISPDGILYTTRSLRWFCKENNLGDSSALSRASKGLYLNGHYYKGWYITRILISQVQ